MAIKKITIGVNIKNFSINNIEEIQLEISTYCNASCPQCQRNINGGKVNPNFKQVYLSLDIIKKILEENFPSKLKQIFFCGGYGDPITHPHFLEISRLIGKLRPETYQYTHTNGALHTSDWWRELARIVPSGRGRVAFGIDGLGDTHSIHRKGTDFNKVIENASSFIRAGGCAQWSFLVFRHNEHQVEEARELSKELGFNSFQVRSSGRFFNQKNLEAMDSWSVLDSNGREQYKLFPTSKAEYFNKSMERLSQINSEYGSFMNYLDDAKIECDSLKGKKILINHEGLVFPCGLLSENLYDARFFDQNIDPGIIEKDGKPFRQFMEIVDSYGSKKLNIHHRSLRDILDEEFYDNIIRSWKESSIKNGKLFECSLSCGKKFTKWLNQNL